MIPFMDLKRQYEGIAEEVADAISDVCRNTAFVGGPFVDKFEKEFAQYISAGRAVSTSNGTDALFLAYRALGIGKGDEVIVPSTTFIATASAVVRTGADVVFADCDGDTWEVDPASVKSRITDRTKAIVGVHLYGQPFDVREISSVAESNGLMMVEDCAQAHGATYDGRVVGTFGKAAAFSFYPGKNLGAYGDAGAVVTSDDAVADRVLALRDHGSVRKYEHDEIGYNMRMDGIQAAVLSVKLRHIAHWTESRRAIARRYDAEIRNPAVKLQKRYDGTNSVHHLYVVEVEDRDGFMGYMKDNGVACAIHYPIACHMQKAFPGESSDDLPNAVRHAQRCVSIPMFPEMMQEEVDKVVDLCNDY